MSEQIVDGDNPTRHLKVNEDGSINTSTINNINNLRDIATQEELLEEILKELKKMNLHLSLITDITIKNTEVE